MITLTPLARQQLSQLLSEKASSEEHGLRLSVSKGGCAGWQYEMRIALPETGDWISPEENTRLFVAADSLDFLRGITLDYNDSLNDAGFKILNPNASRSCGCGTSFEPQGADPESLPNESELDDCRRPS